MVTIHDLHFLRHPAHGERMGGGYLASTLHRKLPTVEGIIVPSNAVREEVLAHFTQLHRDQVFIVPEGVDPRRFRPVGLGRIQQTLQKRGVTGRYILAVSTLEPRKNMARLFRAVSQWVKAADRADEVPRLMVVGKRGWGGVTIDELCTQSKLDRNRVTWLDDVADHELVGLYGGAEFVVMPSLWEGFGLPILEAMACGRPVIGSNQGALPEVVGDAGILIDPLDEINLSRVMIDLYHAPEERKADLGEMALKRAKSFSWKAAAQGTLQVYREAAAIREARRK